MGEEVRFGYLNHTGSDVLQIQIAESVPDRVNLVVNDSALPNVRHCPIEVIPLSGEG
jgi:hypothetical protein